MDFANRRQVITHHSWEPSYHWLSRTAVTWQKRFSKYWEPALSTYIVSISAGMSLILRTGPTLVTTPVGQSQNFSFREIYWEIEPKRLCKRRCSYVSDIQRRLKTGQQFSQLFARRIETRSAQRASSDKIPVSLSWNVSSRTGFLYWCIETSLLTTIKQYRTRNRPLLMHHFNDNPTENKNVTNSVGLMTDCWHRYRNRLFNCPFSPLSLSQILHSTSCEP